jgi:uncharacterized Zn finger protein (UPF0148 family)
MDITDIEYCPKCGIVPVKRKGRFKALVPCDGCREENRKHRNARRAERRRSLEVKSHRNAADVRYPNKVIPLEVTCDFCHKPFIKTDRQSGRLACTKCRSLKKDELRRKKIELIRAKYWKDPAAAKRKRLANTLRHMGLSIEWYDAQPKVCAICGTDDPGEKGWQLDHDHDCCPYGTRQGCAKCIRGLLCTKCNRGIGFFNEDTDRMLSAIAYIKKHKRLLASRLKEASSRHDVRPSPIRFRKQNP